MDFWTEYGDSLTMLGLYVAGITVYTLIVTALYLPMGTRLMFARKFGDRAVATPGRRFLYVLLFPLFSFAFFLVIAGALVIFNDPNVTGTSAFSLETPDILVIAMATVLAIRICAYFHEDGAKELAKVMPLGLLGFALVTGKVDKIGVALERMLDLLDYIDIMMIFFGVVVVVEFLLRGIYELAGRPGGKKAKAGKQPPPPSPTASFQRRQ